MNLDLWVSKVKKLFEVDVDKIQTWYKDLEENFSDWKFVIGENHRGSFLLVILKQRQDITCQTMRPIIHFVGTVMNQDLNLLNKLCKRRIQR